MRRLLGIDPGLAGGLGVLDVDEYGYPESILVVRTPVLAVRRGRGRRVEYDVPGMRKALARCLDGRWHAPSDGDRILARRWGGEPDGVDAVEIVLEEQQAMPVTLRGRAQGGRSTFRTGLGYGLWLGLVVAADVPYRTVRPATWKKHHRLTGMDKRASLLRCAERLPSAGPFRRTEEGCAEALLLALYVAERSPSPERAHG